MVALTFPKSSTPGARPGEGAGRLVNVYWQFDGERWGLTSQPGLTPFATTGPGPRGFLPVSPAILYEAVEDALTSIDGSGNPTAIGALPGSQPVTMARNNRSPTPDVAIVAEGTAYVATSSSVTDYPDPNVGSPTSVSFLDGYLIFTYGDGTIRASDLNTTAINDQSFTKAESHPDGILRGIVKAGQFIALGQSSTEFYTDAGTIPFPLQRAEVVDTGLFGPWAVAGFEDGWDRPWFSVAADRTVRRWDGYTATIVSTKAVERSIASVAVTTTLRMCVYGFGGAAVVVLSGPDFTWVYHVAEDRWFQRESYGQPRWRAQCSVNAFGKWLLGDTLSSSVMAISRDVRREGDAPLVCTIDGKGPTFPQGARLNDYRVEISTGQGHEEGLDPVETDPAVMISASLNGGASFGNPVRRSLGRQGYYGRPVKVTSMGRARSAGVMVRHEISDPVGFTLYAADFGGVAPRNG